MRVYIDGTEQAARSIRASEIDYDPENDFAIGRYHDSHSSYYFPGQITEVRVWSIARPQADVKASMHDRLAGDEDGLVGYWPLNEGRGDTVVDHSGSDNQGMVHGATWKDDAIHLQPASTQDKPNWESRYQALQAELDKVKNELAEQKAQNGHLQEEVEQSQQALAEQQTQNNRLQEDLEQSQQALTAAQSECTSCQTRCDQLNRELSQIKQRLTTVQAEYTVLQTEYSRMQDEYTQVKQRLSRFRNGPIILKLRKNYYSVTYIRPRSQ